jgi:hypothetical protein
MLGAVSQTVGDCPDFAQSSEQNGTVPFSERVLKLLLTLSRWEKECI